MGSQINLACGSAHLAFELPDNTQVLHVKDPAVQCDPGVFSRRLADFLSRQARDWRSVAVVVADKTRLCGYPEYLPVLLDALSGHGARPGHITIHIAYGTHPLQDLETSQKCYGAAYGRHQWVHHQCERKDAFVSLGRTAQGTPVRILTGIMETSFLITFGAIVHHYFAGFGGGRKLIFPGLGEKQAIYANHGLFLDRQARALAAGCRSGLLDGNPLALDLEAYERHRAADMAVHGLLDSHGRVCDLMVGSGGGHFRDACTRHAAHFENDDDRQYDLVLASCGGYPKDINFIQSHKAIHNAADFVRDGGRLVVLAQCRDGIGSKTFLPWFELGGWDAAFDRLSAQYVGNGGTALAMMAKLKRIRIGLVTDLEPAMADLIGYEHLTGGHARRLLRQHTGSLAVIPNASLLVKKPRSSEIRTV
jgi:nickel-dependent lactate racemase